MRIPAAKIGRYELIFPVLIYPEMGDTPLAEIDAADLQQLIAGDCVVGYGSWKRIRKLRLNRPEEKLVALRLKLRHSLIADCNRTVILEKVGTQGARAWKHLRGRSLAYGGRGRELDGSCL